jgi:hypothetical protein
MRKGLGRLDSLIERWSSLESLESEPTNASSSFDIPTHGSSEEETRRTEQKADQAAVEEELRVYIEEPIVQGDELEDFDLLRYWQVRFYAISSSTH